MMTENDSMFFYKTYVYQVSGIATSLKLHQLPQPVQAYWMLQLESCWGILSRLLWTLGWFDL